jgi:hypothetical protein
MCRRAIRTFLRLPLLERCAWSGQLIRDGNWTALRVGHQTVVDLEQAWLAIVTVTELRQWARQTFNAARRQSLEGAVPEGPCHKLLLDLGLAFESQSVAA